MQDGQRTIEGFVQLPEGGTGSAEGDALVELRDVSAQDAPSQVIASVRLRKVSLAPGTRLPFQLRAAAASPAAALNLRVQVQAAGATYLTTQAYPVQPSGDVHGLVVALEKVSG